MSRKAKKRCKGAISIFLIIIFISCYVLTGLLVDGGRYRLAMTMAESTLDTASNSILSRYNKLVYDLYGLLATDSVKEEDLTELFTHYVDDTLMLSDIDYSGLSTMLGDAIMGGANGDSSKYLDLYDFDAEITSGSSVTLATTENVEYQILEHMKYRAPLQVMKGADNFLNNIASVLTVKDRLVATKERILITKEYESKDLFQHCSDLINKIDTYCEELLAYSIEPHGDHTTMDGVSDPNHAKDSKEYIQEFDDKVTDIRRREKEEIEEELEEALEEKREEEASDDDEDGGDSYWDIWLTEEEEEEVRDMVEARYQSEYDDAKEQLLATFDTLQVHASILCEKAKKLRDEIEKVNQEYEAYIASLEAKMNEHSDNQDYKTVFEPEIELAKANCGEVLKNIEIILSSRKWTNELGDDAVSIGTANNSLNLAAEDIIENLRTETGYTSLESAMNAGSGASAVCNLVGDYVVEVNENLNSIYDKAGYFQHGKKPEINVRDVDTIKKEEKLEEEKEVKEKDSLRPLNKDDLAVQFTLKEEENPNTCIINADFQDVNGENVDVVEIMNSGLNLIETIGNMLEGARDNLYVNEYVISTFPNVVHHYNIDEKDRDKYKDEMVNHLFEDDYPKYQATQAEVEYIITGVANTKNSVINIEARLLGVRMLFNMVAIFTDTAKISQANTIAAAAGPFAPVASILLLTAWALAESAIDVSYLMNGEKVALLKQSKDWQISVEGMVEKVLKEFANGARDYISDNAIQYLENAEEHVNGVIYNVYNKVTDVGDAIKQAEMEMGMWVEAGNSSEILEIQMVNAEFLNTFQSELSSVGDRVNEIADNAKEQAVVAVSKAFEETKKTVENFAKGKLNSLTDSAMEKFAGKLPIGKVVSGGSSENKEIKFGYMDYIRIFLLFMNQTVKVQRIQQLIQANIRYSEKDNPKFSLENCHTGVWADMKCSIRFLFMSEAIIPEGLKKNGRLTFTVHSAKTY